MNYRRIYAIPDVHGRLDLFDQALEILDCDGYDKSQDLLVILGDMIDRGPDSKGVLDLCISLQKDAPNTVVVLRGNHEDFAVDHYVKHKPQAKDAWYYNGGWNTEQSYPNCKMSEEHVKYLGGLPYSYEAQGFYFSHAPVPRDKARTGRGWGADEAKGLRGEEYSVWERTWYYIGPESERPGGMMEVHEGPRSQNGVGKEHLTGVCGHIHRGLSVTKARIFPRYRMLDSGAGCYPKSPLAIHECLSNRTLYSRPEDLDLETYKPGHDDPTD